MSLVISFGTFDNFHPGHASYLSQAFALADEMLVIIARDENVERIKGKKPRQDELIRKKGVASFMQREKIKGRAYLGYRSESLRVIAKYRPDYIALGYDQRADVNKIKVIVKELALKTKIVRLKSYYPDKFKSSILRNIN
jgi:FAD synthetase